jgi:chromosome segregation ATPase
MNEQQILLVRKDLETAMGKLKTLEEEKISINRELTQARSDLAKAKTANSLEISNLSNKLRESEKEVVSLKLKIKDCNNPKDMLALQKRLEETERGVQSRQEGIDRLKKEKIDLDKKKNDQINEIKSERDTLKSDLQKCKSSKGTDTEDIKSYVRESERLKAELKAVNKELEELKASNSRASSPVSSESNESIESPVVPKKSRKNFESFDPFYEKYMKYKQKYFQLKAGNNFA